MTTATGDIRFASATDIVLGGVITTQANVALTATAGSITDLDTDNTVDVIAAGLRLVAGTNVGTATNFLETTLATLSARGTAEGLFLTETNALTVGTVAVAVSRVNADGTLSAIADEAQSGVLTTAGNGVIALTTGGALTINAAVAAQGSGSVTLQSGGDLTLGAAVSSTSGALTLTTAARLLETTADEQPVLLTTGLLTLTAVAGVGQTGRGDLDLQVGTVHVANTGVGSVYLESHAAAVTLGSATLGSAGSLFFTQSAGTLAVTGAVTVPNGHATLRATGTLTLTNAPVTVAGDLTLRAAGLVTTASPLTVGGDATLVSGTTIALGSPLTAAGDVSLASAGHTTVRNVTAGGVLDLQVGGNLTTGAAGDVLTAEHLRLTVAGNVGSSGQPVRTDSGSADLKVGGSTNLQEQDGLTAGRGGVDLSTAAGTETVINLNGGTLGSAGGAIVSQGAGTLVLQVTGTLTLGTTVSAPQGNIRIVADRVVDGTGDEGVLLSAPNGQVLLVVQTGAGSSSGAGQLEFIAGTLSATTQSGELVFRTSGAAVLGAMQIATGSGLLAVSAGGALSATGTIRHLGTGALTLTATGNLTAANPLSTTSGALTLTSTNGALTLSGTATTTSGALSLSARNDIQLATLASATGLVTLASTTGSLLRLHAGVNITATTTPILQAARTIDLTVQADTVSTNGTLVFRRDAPSIVLYLVFS